MAKDATVALYKIGARMTWDATMTPDHISARTTYVMLREDQLWNFGVLQRVRLSSLVMQTPRDGYTDKTVCMKTAVTG
jgi:hypothetical protein